MAALRIQSAIEDLAEQVLGPVFGPQDDGYAEEAAAWNAAHVHRPDVVVGAINAADVQAAVRWANANDLAVSVQATGHGATFSIDGGVLITTKRMQGLHIDPHSRLAIIEAGVKWRRVIDEAAPFELAPLNGSSSDAGAIGYTLGGGLAVLGRTYGFASDWVVAFEIVTADGELRRVTAEDDSEVFWALRGGKVNVGIVTSMTVELLPVSEFYGGSIYYDGEHAAEILRAYAEWTASLPDEMTTAIALMRLPAMPDVPEPLQERFTVQLRVAHLGEGGDALMQPMRDVAPAIIDYVGLMPYTEVDRVHNDPEGPLPFDYVGTVLSELSGASIDALMAEAGPGVETPLIMVEIRHLGGAMERPSSDDAVGLRTPGFAVFFLAPLMPEIAPIVPEVLASAAESLVPFETGATFVNLHGGVKSEDDRVRPWSGEQVDRIVALKQRIDPGNRFRFGHWA